jgi:hypothetical protein
VLGSHGTKPLCFPVFSKPIINLKGMGVGGRVLRSQADYDAHAAPGHFWMRLLEGRHVSSAAPPTQCGHDALSGFEPVDRGLCRRYSRGPANGSGGRIKEGFRP